MVTNGGPFWAAYDANVLDRENSKEQVFVSSIIPIFTIHSEFNGNRVIVDVTKSDGLQGGNATVDG